MAIKQEYEEYLNTLIKNDYIVKEAMNYSYLANSKRIRSLLLFALLQDYHIDYHLGFAAAAAIEMIHTYSLIHDDLPAFDNDDYRRGQLTNHKKYNETVAILAGDGLLTEAFCQLTNGDYDEKVKVKLITLLATHAGSDGMIKGQSFDMDYENQHITIEQYENMIDLKTGKLLTVPLLFAAAIADKETDYDILKKIGYLIGQVFQIQDDLLDVLSNQQQTGKSSSDLENHKNTYIVLTSIEQTKIKIEELFNQIYNLTVNYPHLAQLIKSLEKRTW